jgi:copper homeostasis protein (lipoprotein)
MTLEDVPALGVVRCPALAIRGGVLRHNRGMRQAHARRFLAASLAGLVLALGAGCERQRDAAPPVLAPIEQGDGRIEWSGMQPCADCEGIETTLVLARADGAQTFVLSEVYLADPPARFVAGGRWKRDGGLLRLDADDGARFGYAVLADGSLQPRDLRGRRLSTRDGDGVLAPVASSSER